MLFIVLGVALLLAFGFYTWRSQQTDQVRERLAYGMYEDEEPEEEDLTAGNYGLRGTARLGYAITAFLADWRGRTVLGVAGAGLGFMFATSQGRPVDAALSLSAASGMVLLSVVLILLNGRRRTRERRIRKALPDALELIAAIMEGGVAFEGALGHVVRESDATHPLYFELSVLLEAMRRGRRRHEALKLWGQRCNIAEVAEVVSGLTQAEQTGGSLATVLRHHARSLFREYEAEVQRRAERLPIRMMFPMLMTILPAMFIVTGLPSLLRIIRVMESIMRSAP
ncbi:type II secretion system F family protein [Methyloversatilis sp.]|uniref:type II secretion system F family protein n=1 Tax=Methyloversatilis sp. TaxID=2569862 RepID=UPI0035ADE6EE